MTPGQSTDVDAIDHLSLLSGTGMLFPFLKRPKDNTSGYKKSKYAVNWHRSQRCHLWPGCQTVSRIGKLEVLIKVYGMAGNNDHML